MYYLSYRCAPHFKGASSSLKFTNVTRLSIQCLVTRPNAVSNAKKSQQRKTLGTAVTPDSHSPLAETMEGPSHAHIRPANYYSTATTIINLLVYSDPAGSLVFSINTNSGTTMAKTSAYMTKVTAMIFASSLYRRCQLARSNVIQAVWKST